LWEKIEDKRDQLWNNLVRCAVGLGGDSPPMIKHFGRAVIPSGVDGDGVPG
jgi:hypothetical protein